MTESAKNAPSNGRTFGSLVYDPKVRSIFFQLLTAAVFIILVWMIAHNVASNLARSNTASGFGFLNSRAGFDIGDSLVPYTADSSYGRAIFVGFLNTIMIAFVGIITATIVGFLIGIGRLSHNWLIAKICTVYVEIFRNIPPLLVIFFLYKGVLSALPNVRDSLEIPGVHVFLNNRGLVFPKPIWGNGAEFVALALVLAIVATIILAKWATKRQMATGQPFPTFKAGLALIVGLPLIVFAVLGAPISFDIPQAGRFNLTGGATVLPEFFSLYVALSLYTGSFIAEIIRAGIRGVAKGQTEAATALGIQPSTTTRLVVVPQAMRIIIPPLTSQYLNLTKNSSLGIAVGFPDLVATGGTTLNQTGQAVEVVAIWMVVYLSISVASSMFMNWFNAKMALVER